MRLVGRSHSTFLGGTSVAFQPPRSPVGTSCSSAPLAPSRASMESLESVSSLERRGLEQRGPVLESKEDKGNRSTKARRRRNRKGGGSILRARGRRKAKETERA